MWGPDGEEHHVCPGDVWDDCAREEVESYFNSCLGKGNRVGAVRGETPQSGGSVCCSGCGAQGDDAD